MVEVGKIVRPITILSSRGAFMEYGNVRFLSTGKVHRSIGDKTLCGFDGNRFTSMTDDYVTCKRCQEVMRAEARYREATSIILETPLGHRIKTPAWRDEGCLGCLVKISDRYGYKATYLDGTKITASCGHALDEVLSPKGKP
jgi:hypothetical protein